MKLRLTELKYAGHIISKDGIKSDPKKIERVLNLPSPTNAVQLKRFMGMVCYISKLIPTMSKHTEQLRKLEQKSQDWHRSDNH